MNADEAFGSSEEGKSRRVEEQGLERARTPVATKLLLMPLLKHYGISRVSELTGLDRIGIPVFSAIRPLAATVTVSAGKGRCANTAWVSAVMEAIEAQLAEQFDPEPKFLSAASDLALNYDPRDLDAHPISIFDSQTQMTWTEALNIVDNSQTFVPVDAVGLRGWFSETWQIPTFVRTSNGLAAGNTRREAILHALLELVERDALEKSSIADDNKVALDAIDGFAGTTIEAVRAAGASISLYRLTSLKDTYSFACYIKQPEMPQVFGGSGCHLQPKIAAERAILEAVQSRMSIISGLRDDIAPWMYDNLLRPPRALQETASQSAAWGAAPVQNWSLQDAIEQIVGTINQHTGQPVIAVDLQKNPNMFPPVVQVLASGMKPSPTMKVPN